MVHNLLFPQPVAGRGYTMAAAPILESPEVTRGDQIANEAPELGANLAVGGRIAFKKALAQGNQVRAIPFLVLSGDVVPPRH